MEDIITKRLDILKPTELKIINDSHLHRGHSGNNGGEHFTIHIGSPFFKNKSLIEKHRMIYDLLDDLMPNQIHALQIKVT